MKRIFAAFLFIGANAIAQEYQVVEFHIEKGTAKGAWNTADTAVNAKIGDVIRIYNDDNVTHQLHTFGAPCGHGPAIPAGNAWDCVVAAEYSAKVSGPLYDHLAGMKAEFWVEATK
jgi:hypothetical protein